MSELSENEQWEKEFWEANERPNTDEEMGWYRLWFEFLNLSDPKKRSNEVTNDFGDVSGDFDKWWPKHSYLFRQMKHTTVEEIITDHDFQVYKDDGSMPDNKAVIMLVVNLYEPKAVLRAAFDEILSKHHKGGAGRPEFDHWGDVYNLKKRPDTDMLKKILAVYRLYIADQTKSKRDQRALWQIEEEVSKSTPLIDKTSEKATNMWTTDEIDPTIIESRRRSQHTTVRKYLNYAGQILENVVNGNFPVYDKA